MKLKKIFLTLEKYYYSTSSRKYCYFLKKKGVKIGNDVIFISPRSTLIDLTRPYMLEIGNNVIITDGVKIISHGFDWIVLREIYHRPFGSAGKIIIGNNIFIGINAIILKNVVIGDNCIIGAGSIVTKSIPNNSVVCGNPAKIICSTTDLYEKYLERELYESKDIIDQIRNNLKREPLEEDFREFFHLFLPRDPKKFGKIPVKHQVGDYYDNFIKSKPRFNNFIEFINYLDQIKK